MWVTGTQLWWGSTSPISTPHYSGSHKYYVVQGQERRWDSLLWFLLTHPNRGYWPSTHGGKDQTYVPLLWMLTGWTYHQIECCIDEWSDGIWKESNWSEERCKGIYRSHLSSLHNFCDLGHHRQNGDLLVQIQFELLRDAR